MPDYIDNISENNNSEDDAEEFSEDTLLSNAQHAKSEEIIELDDDIELDDEVIELEFDEESVEYYIDDEDGNEIGVCLNEDGQLVEYMYEDTDSSVDNSEHVGINDQSNAQDNSALTEHVKAVSDNINETREELLDAKDDAIAVAKELKETAGDLKDMYDDLMDSLHPFKKRNK